MIIITILSLSLSLSVHQIGRGGVCGEMSSTDPVDAVFHHAAHTHTHAPPVVVHHAYRPPRCQNTDR